MTKKEQSHLESAVCKAWIVVRETAYNSSRISSRLVFGETYSRALSCYEDAVASWVTIGLLTGCKPYEMVKTLKGTFNPLAGQPHEQSKLSDLIHRLMVAATGNQAWYQAV